MVNYFYDCYSILNKVYSEKAFLKQAINSTFIEEKNRPLTIKTCYGVLDKDIELSYYIKKLANKSPKLVIRTILKIAMYSMKYLSKHDYAVIDNAVSLVKKLGKGGMSGFVNAFLRKFAKEDIPLPKDKMGYLSVKYSYPLFAVEELIKDYGEENAIKIMASENKKTCVVFYEEDGKKYLEERGIQAEETPFSNVFICSNFVRNSDYDNGTYTFQALGSVAICEAIMPCENLLDACAAPGGKSVRLSFKCKNVTSFDVHKHRVELIEEYKNRLKRDNIVARVCNSKEYFNQYKEAFDAVLVDAPCTGLGVVNDNPDIKLNREKSDMENLIKEQFSILKNVSKYVKDGGYLYYSTCSVLKKENILQVENFLKEHKEFSLEQIDSKLEGVLENGTMQFLPHVSGGLGFFVAKLKKRAR